MTNKARLVKREEYLQKKQERQEEAKKPVATMAVATVKRWVQEKCNPEPRSPRQQFAALFAAPQAS